MRSHIALLKGTVQRYEADEIRPTVLWHLSAQSPRHSKESEGTENEVGTGLDTGPKVLSLSLKYILEYSGFILVHDVACLRTLASHVAEVHGR